MDFTFFERQNKSTVLFELDIMDDLVTYVDYSIWLWTKLNSNGFTSVINRNIFSEDVIRWWTKKKYESECNFIITSFDGFKSFGYASQEAWIITGTIKENILMGRKLDQQKYDAVVLAASLKSGFHPYFTLISYLTITFDGRIGSFGFWLFFHVILISL